MSIVFTMSKCQRLHDCKLLLVPLSSNVVSSWRYATPFGLTSEYAHPAEILFLGFATVVGPALTGPHLFTLWLWVILRVLETVDAHSGYDFPWSPSNFLPLYGGCVVTVYLVVCSFVDAFWFSWCLLIEIWLFPAVLISMTTTIACFIRSQGTTHRPLSTWTGVYPCSSLSFLNFLSSDS